MLASLRRGILTLGRRRIHLFMMIVVPLAGAFFFLSLMHSGLPVQIPVGIVDQDNSPMSRQISRALDAEMLIDITESSESYSAAMDKVKSGETYGFFLIPRGFQQQALSGRTPTISYITNMSIFVPGTLSYKAFTTVAVQTVSGVVTSTLEVTGLSAALGSSGSSSLMPLRLDTHPIGNPCTNYSIYLSPSFLIGLLGLLTMVVTVFTITSEFKQGTSPEWLATAKGSMLAALAGKLLPQAVILSAMGIFTQAVMFKWLDFPMHCPAWHMVLALVLLVLASQAFAVVVVEILPNMRLALVTVSLVSILTFSIAGFSFPVDKMYGAIGIFAYILPVRYYFLIYI
ncbi:MAG: ABC transporter permease, partial [Duncaniella sp.]|nr:ABC transporter permease [Duncaniella sp.]